MEIHYYMIKEQYCIRNIYSQFFMNENIGSVNVNVFHIFYIQYFHIILH